MRTGFAGTFARTALRAIAVAVVTLGAAGPVLAQGGADATGYPNRPVRIVVPLPAGGPTDINIRLIGQKLSERWGQPIVVENRPGGNTGIGAQVVATAAPDGYTLLAAQDSTLVMNPASGASMTYDPFKDFAAISLINRNVSLLTVRASDGPKTVKELIARAKANPGKLNYGGGVVTVRVAGHLFAKMAGIDVVMIPYKGSAEAVQALLGGSVDYIIDGIASSVPLIQGGQFRPLAKLSNGPVTVLPDLQPLSVAAGLPELGEMSTWVGLLAPAGTPPGIVDKIHRDLVEVYKDPDVRQRLDKVGINPVTMAPAEFDKFFRAEAARWTKVFKESAIKF